MSALRYARWIAVVLFVAGSAQAQRPAARRTEPKPPDVMRAFFDAVAHERWVEAAAMLDLELLERGRRQQMEWRRHPPPDNPPTVEELMRHDPEMPRAVAEYQIAQAERFKSTAGEMLSFEYANVRDTTMLVRMSALELGARWLEAQDSRYQMRRSAELAPDCADKLDTILSSVPAPPPREVLGAVGRGDTVFVLHRDSTSAGDAESVMPFFGTSVATLVLRRGGWRIVPQMTLLREVGSVSGMSFVSIERVRKDSLPP